MCHQFKSIDKTNVERPVETVHVCAIADHRHRYKLTGVTRYVCVSGPVRRMSLSPHVTMISHQTGPSGGLVTLYSCDSHVYRIVYIPMPMRLI